MTTAGLRTTATATPTSATAPPDVIGMRPQRAHRSALPRQGPLARRRDGRRRRRGGRTFGDHPFRHGARPDQWSRRTTALSRRRNKRQLPTACSRHRRPGRPAPAVHSEEFAKGAAFAAGARRARGSPAAPAVRQCRPTASSPPASDTAGAPCTRGIDIANSIGTPIYAVADGVVTDAGPTAGYGAWVKIRHADGTVTLYGHVNTWLVSVGQRVMAGDQIATIGNRGNSTGPHCTSRSCSTAPISSTPAVARAARSQRRRLRRLTVTRPTLRTPSEPASGEQTRIIRRAPTGADTDPGGRHAYRHHPAPPHRTAFPAAPPSRRPAASRQATAPRPCRHPQGRRVALRAVPGPRRRRDHRRASSPCSAAGPPRSSPPT